MKNFGKVFFSFCLLVLAGCGGGGGSESNNSQSTSAPPSTPSPVKVMNCAQKTYIQADFDQEISEPSCSNENNVSVFARKYADGSGVYLDIWTKVTTPIFTQSFYLAYDPNVLQYVSHEPGKFFGTDSVIAEAVMRSDEGAAGGTFWGCDQEPGKSVVMISVSRHGAYTAELSGNNLAIRLKFRIAGSGETDLVFAKAKLERRTYDPSNPLTELSSCWPKSLKIKI